MAEKFLIWIVSFLILALLLYVSYKISYKLGIKKALYRTTYILLCVIFAFVLAPVVTNNLLGMDLTKLGITLYYEDKSFFSIIDFVEEVIAHSEFLNDLYKYFPSLKNLLMDFPHLVLAPITYVVLFLVFIIVLLPLYLYLSYKRKRRILYERQDIKKQHVWAGILGCVQCIFVVSVIFSPINGISRIYQNATSNTLENENASLCNEHETLKKYKVYCDVIEAYSSTIFSTIGGNDSISDFVFDSLTRISYDNGNTSLANEASLIIKSGIVLNQSGFLDAVNGIDEFVPLELIIENKLTDNDIDIIVETLSNSKYSENILMELGTVLPNTLNEILSLILNQNLSIEYSIDKEYIINEIKVVLKALTLFSDNTLFESFLDARDVITHYVYEIPRNRKNEKELYKFVSNLVDVVDISQVELFGEYLIESKIFNQVVPYILDSFLDEYGFRFVSGGGDLLDLFYTFMDFGRIIEKYHPHDTIELISSLDDDDVILAAEIIEYLINCPDSRGFVNYILSCLFTNKFVYSTSDIYSITDWTKEVKVARDVCKLLMRVRDGGSIDIYDIKFILNKEEYNGSKFFEIGFNFGVQNIQQLLKELIAIATK